MMINQKSKASSSVRLAQALTATLLGLTVASCGTTDGVARSIEAAPPSVTYEYSNDEGLIDAMLKAEEYCLRFNSWPTTSKERPPSDGEVTFICELPRAAQQVVQQQSTSPQPTVNYTYSDEQGLLDATNQAQRYCSSYGGQAKSTTITDDGGTHTVAFECVR